MSEKSVLTKKDFTQVFWRSWLMQLCFTSDRMQGLGFGYAIKECLRKIWPNDDDYQKALERHYAPFNMTVAPAPLVMGIALAMEEAAKAEPEKFDFGSINAVKVALMGPLSGVGDAFFWGIIKLLASASAVGLAQQGNILAPFVLLLVFNVPNVLVRYFTLKIGYEGGQNFLAGLQSSGKLQQITYCAGVLGMCAAGCMIALWCSISCPLTFELGGATFVVQETLDSVLPKLLPLCFTLGAYSLLKKGKTNIQVTLIYAILGFVLGALNIIGA